MAGDSVADVSTPSEEAVTLGCQLAKAGHSKDALVKVLKRAASFLKGLNQSAEAQHSAKDIAEELANSHILKHKDKDVKICAARCFCQVLKIWAPHTPYGSDEVLAEMLAWFLVIFKLLGSPDSPTFEVCLSTLDVIAQTKCFLLLLDLNHPSRQKLVCSTFELLLEAISEESIGRLHDPVFRVLTCMLLEADEVSQDQLEVILRNLVPPRSTSNPAAARFVAELLRETEKGARPALHKFLVSVVEGKAGGELREEHHRLLLQIHQILPAVMVPILPLLVDGLSADGPGRRVAALELLGKLFSVPEGRAVSTGMPELFLEFLKRAVDLEADVREAFLQLAPSVAGNIAPKSQKLLMKELTERLMDHEEELRASAVAAICKTAIQAPEAVHLKELEEVAGRLRDKKMPVRKEAAQQLMTVFRAFCMSATDADGLLIRQVIWIPGRLCLAACKDPDLGCFVLDNMFKTGLLPPNVTAADAAILWGTIYAACSPQERASIMRLLKIQAGIRTHLRTFVELRGALHEEDVAAKAGGTPPPLDKDAERLKHAINSISRVYPDQKKTADLLHRLRELKDNHIFKRLLSLTEPGLTSEAAELLAKEVVARIGSSGGHSRPLSDFSRSLCSRLFPGLLPEAHAVAALERLVRGGTDTDVGHNLMQLVVESSAANPHLFALAAELVAKLLEEDEADLTRTAAQILAHAGSLIAVGTPHLAGELASRMERLCRVGDMKTAKAAARGLANVLGRKEAAGKLEELCTELAGNLEASDPGVVAKLEALSGIGRLAPDIFAKHVTTVIQSGLQALLDCKLEDLGNRDVISSVPIWARYTKADAVKARAVKAVARGFVPAAAVTRLPDELLSALPALEAELVRELEQEGLDDEGPLDSDWRKSMGYRRLMGATALLKLATVYDAKLQITTFLRLALIMQDNMSQVRAAFSAKLLRLVGALHNQAGGARKASKYAAVLALAALDPIDDLRKSAFASLQQYGINRRAAAAAKATQPALVSSGAIAVHEQPEFLLPFLVQILAHHPDLPTPEELNGDPEPLEHFARMLQFALQALMLPDGGTPEKAATSYSMIVKLLRTIKTTEDATADPQTERICIMCDLGLSMARTLLEGRFKENMPEVVKFSGGCPLPVSLFTSLAGKRIGGRLRDGSYLPAAYKCELGGRFQPPSRSAYPEGGPQRTKSGPSSVRKTKTETQRQARLPAGTTPFSRRRREPEVTGATEMSRSKKARQDEGPGIAILTEEAPAAAEGPSRGRRTLRAPSVADVTPPLKGHRREDLQSPAPDNSARLPKGSEPPLEPSARPSPDENKEPSETGVGPSRRSPFEHPALKAHASRPGRGRWADHAQESALAAEAVERGKQAAAAKRKKQVAAPEEETAAAPSKRQRKPPRPPSGRASPRKRRKGGSDEPQPSREASLEVSRLGQEAKPPEKANHAPSHTADAEPSERQAPKESTPPARPQQKRRNRELESLLDIAHKMGADTNPRSPRSMRHSASSERRLPSQLVSDANDHRQPKEGDPDKLTETPLSPRAASKSAAEEDLRAATADEAEGSERQSSRATKARRGRPKSAPRGSSTANRGGRGRKRKGRRP